MIPNDRFKLWARLQAGLPTAWEQELPQADSSTWGCGRNCVLPLQLRMLCQWAPQKWILTPQVCSPGSLHLRASVLNGYFSPNIWGPNRSGLLNFQSGAGLDTSGPLSPPLGMESCQQVWKRFAVGFTMHGCLEEAFRLMVESQKGCGWHKGLQRASAHTSVGCVWGVIASFQSSERRVPLLIPPLAAGPAGSMKGHQKPVPEPATKQVGNWGSPCKRGLEYLISILCLDV